MTRIAAYGHSWVFGTGATRHTDGFVGIAARTIGWELDNRAVSGSLSTQTAALVAAHPPPEARAYMLMTGLNDARLFGDAGADQANYAAAISAILTSFTSTSPEAMILVVNQPLILNYSRHEPYDKGSDVVLNAYNRILAKIVSRHPLARQVTIDGWDPCTMLSPDAVHPNDDGHRQLANAVLKELSALSTRNR